MQTTSDGGVGPLPSGVTVPLMVQPEALAQTAARLEEVATNLQTCLGRTSAKLGPTPPGHDEVSTSASLGFAAQGANATRQISAAIARLREAAANCSASAEQYQQTDESFGSSR